MWCKRKWKIQNGGSQTENTYISTCLPRTSIIPTTIPMFLRMMNSNKLFRSCVVQAGVKNSRWRLTNRKYLYFNHYIMLLHDFNDNIYVFEVEVFHWAISDIVWCKRKWKIQNGGSQTGNTYISTCLPRSSIIPTTIPMFLRLRNSTELFPTLSDASGS